jgi:flagellar basal-body rod protein FlgB
MPNANLPREVWVAFQFIEHNGFYQQNNWTCKSLKYIKIFKIFGDENNLACKTSMVKIAGFSHFLSAARQANGMRNLPTALVEDFSSHPPRHMVIPSGKMTSHVLPMSEVLPWDEAETGEKDQSFGFRFQINAQNTAILIYGPRALLSNLLIPVNQSIFSVPCRNLEQSLICFSTIAWRMSLLSILQKLLICISFNELAKRALPENGFMALCLQNLDSVFLEGRMIKNFLLNKTNIPNLEKGLNVYALRQKVIAGNIANVETSGYRRKEVEFEDTLQTAVKKHLRGVQTDSHHLAIGGADTENAKAQIVEDPSTENSSGVNNVNIDKEIIDQVKNEIRYLYGSRLISKNFAALRASIKGRFDI